MKHQIITRFGEPTKMDTATYATICKTSSSADAIDLYVQISHNEEDPRWIFVGKYSNDITNKFIYDEVNYLLKSE